MPIFNIRNFPQILRVSGLVFRGRRSFGIRVINKSGSSIAASKLVAISGYDTTTKLPKIVLADADAANLATDVYVTKAAIANNAQADVYKGIMSPATLDTSGVTTVGDPVYLDTTAGAFTATAPTGAARVVIVGYAQVKSSTVGQVAFDIQPASKISSLDLTTVGYATGQGGAVTQGTNRTTTVIVNALAGAITLISAAGSATPATFTVTNSFVAATDVIVVNQKSGTDKYEIFVTAVGAGSFNITSFTTGGTTTETPVFNFAVIKGAAS